MALSTSRDDAISEPAQSARWHVQHAPSFAELLRRHQVSWHHPWRRFHIEIADDETSRVLNLPRLPPAVDRLRALRRPRRGRPRARPARGGLPGPHLLGRPADLPVPDPARAAAHARAAALPLPAAPGGAGGSRGGRLRGAMFPWQSGSYGTEATPRLLFNTRSGRWINDNSGLQRHVDVAIAYNVWQYYQVSADIDFMASFGAELLLEIARFLASITSYDAVLDRYEIRGRRRPRRVPQRLPREPRAGAPQQRLHERHGRVGPVPRPRRGRGPGSAAPRTHRRSDRAGPRRAGALGGDQPQARDPLPR